MKLLCGQIKMFWPALLSVIILSIYKVRNKLLFDLRNSGKLKFLLGEICIEMVGWRKIEIEKKFLLRRVRERKENGGTEKEETRRGLEMFDLKTPKG